MKAILTKPEKEKLLEQFEKFEKTYVQFAGENGLNVKTLSKWIYEWHHQIKTTNEVKFVEIKTTVISSVNDIRIKKSGMEILIPADLEQYQLKNIPTVLASILKLILRMRKSTCAREAHNRLVNWSGCFSENYQEQMCILKGRLLIIGFAAFFLIRIFFDYLCKIHYIYIVI